MHSLPCSAPLAGLGLLALGVVCPAAQAPPELPWHEAVAASLAAHGVAQRRDPALVEATFSFRPEIPARTVHLTGDFADWDPEAIPMADPDGDGVWTVTHALRPGEHLYKFVVDGARWFHDPANPDRVDDGHQGFNSVLRVAMPHGAALGAAARDGHVEAAMLFHDPSLDSSLRRTGPRALEVTLRTLRGDVEAVDLLWGVADPPHRIRADWVWSDDLFDHHRAVLDLGPHEMGRPLGYLFEVRDGPDAVRLGAGGPVPAAGGSALPFVTSPEALALRQVSAWAMDAVWYQIFPERFRNGDPANDEQPAVPWTWEWSRPVTAAEASDFYHFVFERKFGGDLQGVLWALDYLQDLGINAIYFNPVFESISLHKYDAWDHRHIDDNFGVAGDNRDLGESVDPATWVWTPSDRLFLDLVRECHRRGIRVILDGVFNHCGRGHWAFRDVLEHGRASLFADWFKVRSWEPLEYEGWAGEEDLPEFAEDANGLVRPVAEHLFAVTRRWMDPDGDGDPSDGIDGWRLDVPDLIAKPFWREWCALVRAINPDAYLVGELWGRAVDWTAPDLFDAHMNYEWLRGVYRFFINDDPSGPEPVWTASDLNRFLFELQDAYGPQTALVMQNLLDSHDTDRIASAVMNPNRALDAANRLQEPAGAHYDNSRPTPAAFRRVRLIQMFQFTAVGAPMVWYGDEVGMWGADDPECRKPMLWEDLTPRDTPEANGPDPAMRAHVTRLAHLRRALPALRRGHLRPALLDDGRGIYAYMRRLHGQPSLDDVLVVLHRGEGEVAVEVPVPWPDGTAVREEARVDGATAAGPLEVRAGALPVHLGPDDGAIFTALR